MPEEGAEVAESMAHLGRDIAVIPAETAAEIAECEARRAEQALKWKEKVEGWKKRGGELIREYNERRQHEAAAAAEDKERKD